MSVMRSRLRAHAVEWHVAPATHVDAGHRAGFLELQRRCNHELCRHSALIRNVWLDQLEAGAVHEAPLLATLMQMAILLRQLVLAREHHTLLLTERHQLLEGEAGVAVVICFDETGVPWCPPLPSAGIGDPYILSERLHVWWSSWQRAFPALATEEWNLHQGWPATRQLCDVIERDYNAGDLGTALGTMVALENGISTDIWQRLGRVLQHWGDARGQAVPDPGFLPVMETHARLQARHGLHMMEAASMQDLLDADAFFRAGLHALQRLDDVWHALAAGARITH